MAYIETFDIVVRKEAPEARFSRFAIYITG